MKGCGAVGARGLAPREAARQLERMRKKDRRTTVATQIGKRRVEVEHRRRSVELPAPDRLADKQGDDALAYRTQIVHEVKYLAIKHGLSLNAVKTAVTKVGHSRDKFERELKAGKAD